MRVVISGSHGLIGEALVGELGRRGDQVIRLVRTAPRESEARWDPMDGWVQPGTFEGCDAVVHLAGSSIAAGRWNAKQKGQITQSRVQGTTTIVRAICEMTEPPPVLVSGSASGYYGDRGEEELTEANSAGTGFRADVCRAWEAAAVPARDAGVRVVLARSGIVLDPSGGILPVWSRPFRAFIGGPFGNGRQFVPWITLGDEVNALVFAIETATLDGPVNLDSPNPVRNADFARALGSALSRPAATWAPRWAVRIAAGRERADEVLLSSQRMMPRKLLDAGFRFDSPDIQEALNNLLSKEQARTPDQRRLER